MKRAILLLTGLLMVTLAELHAADPNEVRFALDMDGASVAKQPYPLLNGGAFDGPVVKESPDPLVAYRWKETKADDGLQVYSLRPVVAVADMQASFGNLDSATGGKTDITVKGTGSMRLDFGVESAAWLEFDSPDLSGQVEMSISEYNEPGKVNSGPPHPAKTGVPVKYGNTYQLELNRELYEGARFGWIHVRTFSSEWHITGIRLVCQTKPTNYNGSFSCSDPMLTRIWYAGAYGVRLNLTKDYFGAILMDRGDRFSWTGDAHPSQAAALVAFGNYDFLKKNIANTSNQSNDIRSYASLCHPWGGGVTKWLSEEVLGIRPTSPAFKTFDVTPHLGRTLTSVTGTTPTPSGAIRASFNVSSGACMVTVPAGTVGRVGIPKAEKQIEGIMINGKQAWDGGFLPVPAIGGASQDADFVYFKDLQPGTYTMAVAYSGATPSYVEPPEIFPARFVGEDAKTGGNWGGVYGKDGYVLCNYQGNGSDKVMLPAYISGVDYYMSWSGKPNRVVWASETNDPRVIAPNAENGASRTAAGVYSGDPMACQQSFTVTIHVNNQHDYQMALYFVDVDDKGRRQAVDMFDETSLCLISPTRIVKDFRGGKYLIYSYNKSARFRIYHVRGDNAVLSGIFFQNPNP